MNSNMCAFYQKIESEYKVEDHAWSFFSDLRGLSEVDKALIRCEFLALNNFKSDLFKKEIEETKEHIIVYFSERVKIVKNPHLLARYNHILLYITRNNNYASEAIIHYQEALSYYLSVHNQDSHAFHFSNVLDEIISLCTKHKINENTLINQIDGYLKDSSLSPKVKLFILEMIGKNECKLFKSTNLSGYPQLGLDLATNEEDTNTKERLLKIVILLAQKTSDKKSGKVANEMLGDLEYSYIRPLNDNNMAISHLNENHYNNIINYYRLAGQKGKVTKAIKDFEENKKHHRYIKTKIKLPLKNAQKISDSISKCIESLLENTPEVFILNLCFDNGLFPSYKMMNESVEKQVSQSIVNQFFEAKLNDFNNNTISISHEELGRHQFYQIFLQNYTLPFTIELLKRAIDKNKINYSQLKKTLKKSAFGIKYFINRDDSEMEYTWFSLIDIGVREFFKQFKKAVNAKQTDWRFTIDFFAPKFEAIIREIVENTGGEITKVKDNGDSALKSLEDLLASPEIKNVFNDDDMFLFRHTFTKVGRNIRNNVAHGLYKSSGYTLSDAILVFMCILRLNKITIYIANNYRGF